MIDGVKVNDSIEDRFEALNERIEAAARRAGRDPSEIELIVVTKSAIPQDVASVIRAGAVALGENRLQDASVRMNSPDVADAIAGRGVRWHFIGHLQRNKAKGVVERFDRIDSIDSLRIARSVSQRAIERGRVVPILVEINAAREASKYGLPIDDLDMLTETISEMDGMEGIAVRGVMTIGPLAGGRSRLQESFKEMAELRSELGARLPATDFSTLSMGMSGDFELAIEYGSTEVRIGRALFSTPRD